MIIRYEQGYKNLCRVNQIKGVKYNEKKIITDRMCFDDEYCSSCLFINKPVYRSKAGNYEYG